IYIQHLKKINPMINCMTEERFETAKKEAEKIDRQIEEGRSMGRLAGVPMSMKDSFHVAGMRTTGGLKQRKDHIENEDAEVVARIKNEGAVIIAKTNTPSFCFCQET